MTDTEKKILFEIEYMLDVSPGMEERIVAATFSEVATFAASRIGKPMAVEGGADMTITGIVKIESKCAVMVL
jgi:hypothetical protein